MMTAATVCKLLSKCRMIVFLLLFAFTSPSYAGYYYVYSSPGPCCNSCESYHSCGSRYHRVVHHHYHVHYAKVVKHHYHKSPRSQAKIEVYYVWPGLPGAPCGQVWVPDQCDSCGNCSPGYWTSGAYTVYQSQPDDGYTSYVVENPGPDYDMSTRDNDES